MGGQKHKLQSEKRQEHELRYEIYKEFLKISKKKTNKSTKMGKNNTYISEKKKQDWSINTERSSLSVVIREMQIQT